MLGFLRDFRRNTMRFLTQSAAIYAEQNYHHIGLQEQWLI
jgi:hypothetical protein